MKKLLLLIILFAGTAGAQKKDTGYQQLDPDRLLKQIDSSRKVTDSLMEAQSRRMQEEELQRTLEQNNRNLDSFVQMQREREARAKKAMWMRLGLGVFFAAVLVVGLVRRRKKSK